MKEILIKTPQDYVGFAKSLGLADSGLRIEGRLKNPYLKNGLWTTYSNLAEVEREKEYSLQVTANPGTMVPVSLDSVATRITPNPVNLKFRNLISKGGCNYVFDLIQRFQDGGYSPDSLEMSHEDWSGEILFERDVTSLKNITTLVSPKDLHRILRNCKVLQKAS